MISLIWILCKFSSPRRRERSALNPWARCSTFIFHTPPALVVLANFKPPPLHLSLAPLFVLSRCWIMCWCFTLLQFQLLSASSLRDDSATCWSDVNLLTEAFFLARSGRQQLPMVSMNNFPPERKGISCMPMSVQRPDSNRGVDRVMGEGLDTWHLLVDCGKEICR